MSAASAIGSLAAASSSVDDVDVTKADQLSINEFGRLNARKLELIDDIAEEKKSLSQLEDGDVAIMDADESTPGAIKALIGSSFIDVDYATASSLIEKAKGEIDERIKACTVELQTIASRQAVLKVGLYAKFGKNINLED